MIYLSFLKVVITVALETIDTCQYGFRVIRGDEPSAVKHGFKYGNGKEVIKHNLKNLLRLLK